MKAFQHHSVTFQFAHGYERALAAVERARGKADGPGSDWLDYWAQRLRFGMLYLDPVDSVRQAAIASQQGDAARTKHCLSTALTTARQAIEAYASVAHDRSDRGAVVFRRLRAKLAEQTQ